MPRDELAHHCEQAHPRLVGLLVLRTGDRAIAEELAQDTLVELCRAWPDVRDPQAWVTTVALRRAASWWRRKGAERRALRRHGPGEQVSHPEPVETRMAVIDAVARLPRRQQEVLLLRFYAGFDVAETAAALRCAQGTVTSLTHRALQRLEERNVHLDPTGVHDAD